MKEITLFTDGGCRNNPGLGGWGCLLRYAETTKEISGAEQQTTNNRMELTAVIKGLEQLKDPCSVLVVSDSSYVCKGLEQWLANWVKNNWRNSSKKEVSNKDLWQMLHKLSNIHQVKCQWVKGHAGHTENEKADQLANLAMDDFLQKNG